MGIIRYMNVWDWVRLLILLVGFISWCANAYKLIHMSFDPITGMAVARVIGIFLSPLGSVLGFF